LIDQLTDSIAIYVSVCVDGSDHNSATKLPPSCQYLYRFFLIIVISSTRSVFFTF